MPESYLNSEDASGEVLTDQTSPSVIPTESEVTVVGGGLAGLSCAVVLGNNGVDYHLLEKSEVPGGKVTTDRVDGFVLDKGFQVFLEASPMGKRLLDYTKLELRPFYRGLYIDSPSGSRTLISDPLSTNLGVRDLRNILNASDLVGMVQASIAYLRYPKSTTAEIFSQLPTRSVLRRSIAEPFFKGVLSDPELQSPISLTRSIATLFLKGAASLPALGMDSIPRHLASQLGDRLHTKSEVVRVSSKGVELTEGRKISSRCIVIATDAPTARRLVPGSVTEVPYRSVGYTYFSADERPLGHAALYVPSLHKGPVLTVSVPSDISVYYAPQGRHLISVSHSRGASISDIRSQLNKVFRGQSNSWEEIAHGDIDAALPALFGKSLALPNDRLVGQNIVLAGDFLDTPSIDGALASGVNAARTALAIIKGRGSTTPPRVK